MAFDEVLASHIGVSITDVLPYIAEYVWDA